MPADEIAQISQVGLGLINDLSALSGINIKVDLLFKLILNTVLFILLKPEISVLPFGFIFSLFFTRLRQL